MSASTWAIPSRASAVRSGCSKAAAISFPTSLTESGVEVAAKIYERHTLLTRYLEMLGVSAETAAEDACKMEHIISDESFLAIKQHVAAMEKMRPAD